MIRVKTINIKEFRGIRNLTLDMAAKNFGICGANGTGKSGVVDAIEFCITGDVTRLSGEGSSGLSVKAHAPHVDQHGHPENANVTITADIPSLNKSVQIYRSVKNPSKIKITPDEPKIKAIIEELQTHPEFALSRREIVKYIITPPGKRSEDVQTLLRLDYIENLRKSFTTFNNKCRNDVDAAEHALVKAKTDLISGLKIVKFDHALVLEKVNEKRALLGLEALTELTKDTSFKDGVVASQQEEEKETQKETKTMLSKTVALADLSALRLTISNEEPSELSEKRNAAKDSMEQLKEDEKALNLARQHGFIKTGLELITEDACPLCDTEWKANELREYLQAKLLSAQEIENLLTQILDDINVVLLALSERIRAIERVIEHCKNLNPPVVQTELKDYLKELEDSQSAFNNFINDHDKIEPAISAVSNSWWSLSTHQKTRIDECHTAVNALPETSPEQDARDFLVIAQERYDKFLAETKIAEQQDTQSIVSKKALDHYNATCTNVMEGIYDKVANDFSKYYRIINHGDEEEFFSKLTSAPAKLNFDVDFYGRGLFPPGAYHSEGHQDAMGLCLYLALMKHTLGDKFTFAVLDDVLMSIDTGHRREVCRLLTSEFSKTQFILTTHDRVWLQYMKTEGLIAHSQLFGGWTIDSGPRVWDEQDIWTEIQTALDKNDVAKASWLLRRYLEYTAFILADNLRACVEFRNDGNYGLGDLLPSAFKEWQKRLKDGVKSAESWNNNEEKDVLSTKVAKVKTLITKTSIEQWAINPSVHFNEWANLQCHEFQEVVDAFKILLESLRCDNVNCKSYLYVQPRNGKAEEMRCNCGTTIINLKIGS